MAARKLKHEWSPAALPAARELRKAAAAPSPARALQQLLDERTQAAPHVDQWSRRRQLAFIVTSCCALWMALLAGAAQVARAIA